DVRQGGSAERQEREAVEETEHGARVELEAHDVPVLVPRRRRVAPVVEEQGGPEDGPDEGRHRGQQAERRGQDAVADAHPPRVDGLDGRTWNYLTLNETTPRLGRRGCDGP